ncbi:MAG: hypothetical protein ACUVSX_09625 [Aggregatilineales bacterium]
MIAALRRLQRTPFDVAAGNPVFEHDISRHAPAWSQLSLQRASRRAQASAAAVSIAAWLLLWWLSVAGYSAAQPHHIYRASSNVVFWLVMLALGSALLLDMLAVRAGLPGISSDVSARRWELLRLTPLPASSIVTGKHAAAQLRVWRVLAVVVGLRAAAAGLFIVNAFGLSYVLDGVPLFAREQLPAVPLTLMSVAVFVAVYVVEPVWRVRAMTALGLVISSYVLDKSLAALAGGAALIATWLAQTVVVLTLLATMYRMLWMLFSASAFGASALMLSLMFSTILLGFSLVIASAVVGFYTVLQRWSLRQLHRRINRAAK